MSKGQEHILLNRSQNAQKVKINKFNYIETGTYAQPKIVINSTFGIGKNI